MLSIDLDAKERGVDGGRDGEGGCEEMVKEVVLNR